MRIVLSLLAALLILISCNSNKRLERLIRKHPELVTTDTTFTADTLIREAVRMDTSFHFNFDTILIVKENLTTRIIRSMDTIIVMSEVIPDTIIVERMVAVTQVKDRRGWFGRNIKPLIPQLALLLIFAVILLYKLRK